MASIKISQLPVGGPIVSTDEIPVSRGGLETYRILANQIVTTGGNAGGAAEVYKNSDTTIGSTTLNFRSLSGVGEGIQVIQTANTINISISGQNPIKTVFTGTGSQVDFPFSLTNTSSRNINNYRVDIDGVLQEPGQTADYYLNGSNLTFTTAPPLSSKIVVVSNNLLPLAETVPPDNSIINAMFTDGCINTPELSSGAVTTDKIALSAVTTDKIALGAVRYSHLASWQTLSASPTLSAEAVQPRLAKAWVNFDGSTTPPNIRSSFNVSSVVRVGTGYFLIYFIRNMPNSDYCAVATSGNLNAATGSESTATTSRNLNNFAVYTRVASTTAGNNRADISVVVFAA
jgi:hypothetical protein